MEEKIKKALSLYELALKDLEDSKDNPSKIELASKKAWKSTVISVKALIETITGEEYKEELNKKLIELGEDKKIIPLDIFSRYYSREKLFYEGMHLEDTRKFIEKQIIETKDLINDIQKEIVRLAKNE